MAYSSMYKIFPYPHSTWPKISKVYEEGQNVALHPTDEVLDEYGDKTRFDPAPEG